jgi:xylulokinase
VTVEFYEGDGSYGAAIGAGIGAAIYKTAAAAAAGRKPVSVVKPARQEEYNDLYLQWDELLSKQLYNNKHSTHSIML